MKGEEGLAIFQLIIPLVLVVITWSVAYKNNDDKQCPHQVLTPLNVKNNYSDERNYLFSSRQISAYGQVIVHQGLLI